MERHHIFLEVHSQETENKEGENLSLIFPQLNFNAVEKLKRRP